MPVQTSDSLTQKLFSVKDNAVLDSIILSNPMLSMLEAEANAYKAKAEMDKKMSLPMFGIGLQYSIMAKRSEEMARMSGMGNMNGMDMVMPMVKISIPIFRRKYNAQQRESRHYRQASELKYEDTLNQLHAEYIALKQQLADASRNRPVRQAAGLVPVDLAIDDPRIFGRDNFPHGHYPVGTPIVGLQP